MIEIIVIGAGVVGGLVARELSCYRDTHVTILEKEHDVAMGASRANSAIVHAGFDAKEGSLKAALNVKGSEMMEQTAAELGVHYKRNGSLVVAFSSEDIATLEELLVRGQKNGVRDLSIIRDRNELLALEPALGDSVVAALHAPTGAIVCPYTLAIAAVGCAMDNGASLHTDFAVERISFENGRFAVTGGGKTLMADAVINCAGLYSDDVAAMVGDKSFSVSPRRGEYMLMDKEYGTLVSHTIFQTPSKMGKGILITPTVDGNLLAGPTAEDITDKCDRSTTAAGLATILEKAGLSVKSVPARQVITSFTGLRSVGSTGDFIINMPRAGFVNCAGIESPGLSASPAIALYVADMLREAGFIKETDPAAIRTRAPMDAFRRMSDEEKNEVIKKDPRYGKIVCRCENISEGEIVAVIHQNPKPYDTDGVKRRTRSGMGRCQGGFCLPYVTELLAREHGLPYESITKYGGASHINLTKTKGE